MHFFEKDEIQLANYELKSDNCAKFMTQDEQNILSRECIEIGKRAAMAFLGQKCFEVYKIYNDFGITVLIKDRGFSQEKFTIYSEYYQNKKEVLLYENNIKMAYENLIKMPVKRYKNLFTSFEKFKDYFLIHELFHYLECEKIGITFYKYQVVTGVFLFFKIRSYIRNASEISANAFVRKILGEYYE